jgi:cytochrome c553
MVKQLTNFRSGERRGTMNALAADLTDDEITALAEYFNQKPALKHRIHDEEFAAVGKYIFHQGNKFSGVAACASCHGEGGVGTQTLPRLAGQHKRYVSAQLEDFNSRKRTNDNAIMHSIASKLTELERESVALYVSGLE